jgi:ferredoxin
MVVVTLQRKKCIGCNYCVEIAPSQFQMSKKDGKANLLFASDKKGFFTLKSANKSIYESCNLATKACPAKIISTKRV